MKESALYGKIRKAVKAAYPRAYVRKLADKVTRGLPDMIIVCPCVSFFEKQCFGFHFFLAVECKTDEGTQTPIQRQEMEEINSIPGALYIVARSSDEVLDAMKKQGAVR